MIHNKLKQKKLMLPLALTLVAGTALTGCSKAVSGNDVQSAIPVQTQQVNLSDIGGANVFTGQITPEIITNVASKVNGKVTSMNVHVGDHVSVGQTLAAIDTSSIQQQLEQDQSSVALNQAQLNQVKDNQANSIANSKITIASNQAQLSKAQSDHDTSIQSAQQAVDNAKLQLEKAQSDKANNIAQAEQAVAVAQASLDKAKNDHDAAIASAEEAVQEAQASYDNNKQGNSDNIQQLVLAEDQAESAYRLAEQQLNSTDPTDPNYNSLWEQAHAAEDKYLQAQLSLQQAQANSTNDAVLKAPLQKAQLALQTAQNSKDVDVALANYNQAVAKLNQLQSDDSAIKQSQQAYDQALKNLETVQGSTSGIDIAKTQVDAAQQSLKSAQSPDSIAVSQAQLQSALTAVHIASEQLQDGVLKSPVDGVVTAINAPVGQMAGGQGSVVSIASTDPTIAEVNVPESEIGKIKIGTAMTVQIPTLSKVMEGNVLHIHPTIDSVTKSFAVDIQVADPKHQLLPGMFAEATLKTGGKQSIMVPADAVLSEANGNAVYVVENGKAKKIIVQIGEMTSTQYEITSGLKIGDQLVTKGEELLSDGSPVKLENDQVQTKDQNQKESSTTNATKSGTGAKDAGGNK